MTDRATVDVRTKRIERAVDPRTVKRRALKLLSALGETKAELSIFLCDDATIHELNREYRKVDRPTDVLAFPMLGDEREDPPGLPRALGDIVVSVETAARQARQRRRTLIAEVTTLLIHGLLHLLGHDHEHRSDRAAMDRAAKRLEQALGTRTTPVPH
jgi:probable rRNA maturation factor